MLPESTVFALDTEDGTLRIFSSADEAEAGCKGIDVKDGYWLFFADDGSPLEPWFARLPQADDSAVMLDRYTLRRAVTGRWLQERLDKVRALEGEGVDSVAALAEALRINRGKRVIRDNSRQG